MRKCTSSAFLICSRAWRIFLLATLTITIISGRDPSTTDKKIKFITHCGHQNSIILLFRLFNLSRSPKVRIGHCWTGHFENGIGFFQEFFSSLFPLCMLFRIWLIRLDSFDYKLNSYYDGNGPAGQFWQMVSALKHMFYYSLCKIITELTATVVNWNTKTN